MSKPKILMVSANRLKEPYPVYPLGISYLSTYLKTHLPQCGLEIIDLNIVSLGDYIQSVKNNAYTYVCISLRNVDDVNVFSQNSYIEWYREIINATRANCDSKIIIGGAGFSIFPQQIFEYIKPDFGIYSEGEHSLLDLISHLETDLCIGSIEGLIYVNPNGETVMNPRNTFVDGLNLEVAPEVATFYWQRSGMLNVQTKRGCPYHCIYCSYPHIEGTTVRTLDSDIVVENIRRLAKEGMNYLFFTDSIFNIHKEYNIDLAEKIIRSGVKISWGAYFSPSNLDQEELTLYKRSGLTHIEFGTESFCDTQLSNYGKNFTFDDIEHTSHLALDLGIFYAHFLILGGYGETEYTLNQSIQNSKKLNHTLFFPFIGMRIYPQTELSRIAINEGLIVDEKELINPVYYISKGLDVHSIKSKVLLSGGKWIFADDPCSEVMNTLRARGRKGPLWEYLRY